MRGQVFKKVFCIISFLFLLGCATFYGTRFIKLYLENKEKNKREQNYLVKMIKINNENNDNFKKINGTLYFTNDSENNYLKYSNLLWRIIRVNEDNSLTAIADQSLTSLAFGTNTEYIDSYINKWLNNYNEEYTGILAKQLNNVDSYLQKTPACLDKVDTIDNNPCENIDDNHYFSLLSTVDFANIGSKQSYVISNEYFYLGNTNTNGEVWYITDDGKVTLNDGSEIMGIKPVITVRANLDYVSGNGSKDNPYTIEKDKTLFASYVKLGNDIWRIYEVNDTEVRLALNNYIMSGSEPLKYTYSSINGHNSEYNYSSIANYLNKTYLNSRSYKDKLNEVLWPNGYYSDNTEYNYQPALENTIKNKVAMLSIGNIILNNELDSYFTMTSNEAKGTMMYTLKSNRKIYTKNIQSKSTIVPTISINKDLLVKGNGTLDSPYEME